MTDARPSTQTATEETTDSQQLPPYNVVLLNDEEHTYEYVIEMLMKLFHVSVEKAFAMTKTVDTEDRVIVMTTHKELAELKRDQIHGYGRDFRIMSCQGSMSAEIEPALGGGEDDTPLPPSGQDPHS
ncbi:MAG: ATP-dependent Clp protease adaptor ClpS [Planctomycetota bacterium]|nr:ATP-dependent Clp protease adaptor ClpS [Planctomycetota bacterium]